MAIILGSGINITGGILISTGAPFPTAGLVLEYVMGNSVSYNGQGFDLSYGNFTGVDSSLQGTNYIFDMSSDYANGSYGNIGSLHSGATDIGFVNTGPLGYLVFDGNGASGGQYVDSTYVTNNNIPAGSSYTIFSVVRVNDYGNIGTPTGGIVGGDQTVFGFIPPNLPIYVPSNYPSLIASNDSLATGVQDTTTEFQPNTWYAVAVTYDVTSQIMKLYVNGVNTSTGTSIAPFSNPEPLFWGTWEGANWLNGNLAVMSAWDRALTAGEIAAYTTTYGNPYGITSARQFNDMPLQTYSQLYPTATSPTGDPTVFTVPAGVTSISLVSVGAGGGGSGLNDYYSPAGGDTYVYTAWDQRSSNFFTINTGTNINQLVFNCSSAPTNSILGNVAPGWLVTGTQINNTYPDKAAAQGGNAIAVVTSIDTNNLASVIVTLNTYIDSVTGGLDSFYFQGQGIVGAQGGWPVDNTGVYNNGSTGPGQRAIPTIGVNGGRGGVEDYLTNGDSVGGGGAGGYGVPGNNVAFDPNQTLIYEGNGNSYTGVANVVTSLSNYDLTATAVGNTTNTYSATGTYPISPTDQVMFSITLTTWSGSSDTMAVGLGNYGANIAAVLGTDTNSIGYSDVGNVSYNGSWTATGLPTFQSTGKIIDIAVDRSVDAMWVRIDGGDWNGNVSADPATNIEGIEIMQGTPTDPNLYLMVNVGYDTSLGAMSINNSNAYPIPSGFTFIQGDAAGGSTGGDGSAPAVPTMKPGQQADGGGSGAGGGGIYDDTGAGGGGVGLYGAGAPGTVGGWVNQNTAYPPDGSGPLDNTAMAIGGGGGSTVGNSGTQGGTASLWAGGAGGWPGGAGGSGTDYYGGGNAGALAYVNNVSVTPNQAFFVIVGKGGTGSGFSGGVGADGAVRIVWPGDTKTFPYSNVGIDPAGPSSLTISDTYFTQGSGPVITSGGFVVGLTMSGTNTIGDEYGTLYSLANPALAQDIYAFFTQAGMYKANSLNTPNNTNTTDFNAYIFNVTWADSSTGKVRMSWQPDGYLKISVVNTATNDWQTADPGTYPGPTNLTLAGTFSFPAVFTPYTPLIEANGNFWC